MMYHVELEMQGRWCRVGLDYRERYGNQGAQRLAQELSGDGNAVRILRHDAGALAPVIVWDSIRGSVEEPRR